MQKYICLRLFAIKFSNKYKQLQESGEEIVEVSDEAELAEFEVPGGKRAEAAVALLVVVVVVVAEQVNLHMVPQVAWRGERSKKISVIFSDAKDINERIIAFYLSPH